MVVESQARVKITCDYSHGRLPRWPSSSTSMSADLERYISDNSLRVSRLYNWNATCLADQPPVQLFGLSDRSIINYVIASGQCTHALPLASPLKSPSHSILCEVS